ncbi:hypothetical protein FPSE_04890 [Fusarium pseudograminearum CS3096]|uniref:Uncharacterized protein n=1 Tax=Fusarium pseudograminearum (strain CS3096) TaxID=1028729 RepID=K3VK88_FUSPC|nr:hypothetical protein FPSE_04890 [Fusarium pseudograminearum CS3096]EKJ74854.1 hypothetical protein FPSE_04890 [Fusarium pseudograminearum CS3096]
MLSDLALTQAQAPPMVPGLGFSNTWAGSQGIQLPGTRRRWKQVMLSWNSETNVGIEVDVGARLGRLMENGNGSGYGEN